MMSNSLINLYDLALPEIEQLLIGWNQRAYRARQLYRQIYANLVDDPAQMTDLPAALRQRLAAETRLGQIVLARPRVIAFGFGLFRHGEPHRFSSFSTD